MEWQSFDLVTKVYDKIGSDEVQDLYMQDLYFHNSKAVVNEFFDTLSKLNIA